MNFASLDDVAVFRVDAPFDLSGPRVAAIALADSPSDLGGSLRLYGYGLPQPLGELRGFKLVFTARWGCGAALAVPVWLCSRSPDGTACGGDSGGGVVTLSSPPQLIAVTDNRFPPFDNRLQSCQRGDLNGFADVTAPEVLRWVLGDPAPPIGPRQIVASRRLVATAYRPASRRVREHPDGAVRCGAGRWSGAPVVTFTFTDDTTGAVLKDGAGDTYRPTSQNAGRPIRCVVSATNAGGTAQASPSTLWVPTAVALAIQGRRITSRRLNLGFGRRAALTFTDARGREVRRVAIRRAARLRRTMPALRVGAYTVCLEVTLGGRYTAWRECTTATVDPKAGRLVRKVRVRRNGARFRVTLSSTPAAVGQRASVTWLTARCRTCRAHRVRRTVVLRARVTLRSPPIARGREVRLRITLPEIRADGGRYTAGSRTFGVGRRGTV